MGIAALMTAYQHARQHFTIGWVYARHRSPVAAMAWKRARHHLYDKGIASEQCSCQGIEQIVEWIVPWHDCSNLQALPSVDAVMTERYRAKCWPQHNAAVPYRDELQAPRYSR